MIVWDVEIQEVATEDDPDFWEKWATYTVIAENIEDAVRKAIVQVQKDETFFKVRASKAELVREVDIE